MWCFPLTCFFYLSTLCFLSAGAYVTQTVYGFLDFTTTIGDTVMVFSPQSAPALDFPKQSITTNLIKTEPTDSGKEKQIFPTKLSSVYTTTTFNDRSDVKRTKETLLSLSSTISYVENNLFHTEYDLLSRQPTQFAEEKFRIVDHKPGREKAALNQKRLNENKGTDSVYHFRDSTVVTSENFSEVGEYSFQTKKARKSAIRQSSSLRVLKTAAPDSTKTSISPTKTSHRTPSLATRSRKNQKNKSGDGLSLHAALTIDTTTEVTTAKKGRSRNKSKRKHKSSGISIISASKTESNNLRKSSRFKLQPSSVESGTSTSLYMFKLNRTPGRWQYKTSPKPRVSIRKFANDNVYSNESVVSTVALSDQHSLNNNIIFENGDLESLGSQNGAVVNNLEQENKDRLFAETLNVDISTPNDFKNTYFEIATIKTPYIFQAGNLKKTRFLTVTSTLEKTVPVESTEALKEGQPLIENILATNDNTEYLALDSSIKTLNPILISSGEETPSLKTVIETFSSTSRKLKSQILPFIREDLNETSYVTLVQTYDIETLITATKTLSPIDDHFEVSKNFKDFSGLLDEAGSEINLELEFGDTDNVGELEKDPIDAESTIQNKKIYAENSLIHQVSNSGNEGHLQKSSVPNVFNAVEKLSTVITSSTPYIVLETVWDTYVVPILNGKSTNFRTLSKSVGSFEKTQYKLDTTTVILPPIATPQLNPYLIPHLQQFQTVSSPVVHQTIATQTNSKILKLTFGAKTAYTTIYSTEVIPTAVTTYLTTSLPIQPSAAFPPYFPPPFNPYQFVG